jgi:WD40-like Beta Propeller Repeat
VRPTLLLGAVLALLLCAPAQATLVYVKRPDAAQPAVWAAADDGTDRRRLGTGRDPVVSPDGRWAAWVAPGSPERVLIARADGTGTPRRVGRSTTVGRLQFSPDSTQLGMVLQSRLAVHDIPTRSTFHAATGHIRGFSFSPDSKSVVYATSGRNDAVDAPSDLYRIEFDAGPRERITRDRKSLNPLWGPAGIVHDRQRVRDGDAPSFNLFEIQPDGGSLRRITALRIPSGVSGLVPLELSSDGSRLLAELTGGSTRVAFRVNPSTGRARAIESGFVGTDLSADGRTVLGQTGGHVATIPYNGGEPTILVRRAAFPDWSL